MKNNSVPYFLDRSGAIAPIFGLMAAVLLLFVGASVDYGRAYDTKSKLQALIDAATLAAAKGTDAAEQNSIFQERLEASMKDKHGFEVVSGSAKLEPASDGVRGSATGRLDTTFMRMFYSNTLDVAVSATVNLSSTDDAEIVLVLDVSSSMIEEGRFTPMKEAAKKFVSMISDPGSGIKNWRLAIVPFSSRVNISLDNTSVLMPWSGMPAVPDRWSNPSKYYNKSYSTLYWISGIDYAKANTKNYYWMGCVEPRLDFSIHTGASTASAISDDPPSVQKFVAMDDNDKSGKSFCPTPIVPLSNDAGKLSSSIDALTSQGSTRLDAGMVAGWYAISPRWAGFLKGGSNPAEYGSKKKIVVFMTDGRMNTQDDPSSKHFDWVCETSGNCNTYANTKLVETCKLMRDKGITIYSVAYDQDADRSFLSSCASGDDYYFEATSTPGETYIANIYEKIAGDIKGSVPRLIK